MVKKNTKPWQLKSAADGDPFKQQDLPMLNWKSYGGYKYPNQYPLFYSLVSSTFVRSLKRIATTVTAVAGRAHRPGYAGAAGQCQHVVCSSTGDVQSGSRHAQQVRMVRTTITISNNYSNNNDNDHNNELQ